MKYCLMSMVTVFFSLQLYGSCVSCQKENSAPNTEKSMRLSLANSLANELAIASNEELDGSALDSSKLKEVCKRICETTPNISSTGCYIPPYENARILCYTRLCNTPWRAVSRKYIHQFKAEEKKIFQEIGQALNCPPEYDWNGKQWARYKAIEYCRKYEVIKQQHQKWQEEKVDQKIPLIYRSNIQECLKQHHIPLEAITMAPGDFAAGINIMYAPTKFYSFIPHHRMQAIVLHETQHLLHDDKFNNWVVSELLNSNQAKGILTKAKVNELMFKYANMYERRADILACLTHPIYARAGADYGQKYKISVGMHTCAMQISNACCKKNPHEYPNIRFKYMQELYNEMCGAINDEKINRHLAEYQDVDLES